MAEHQSEIEKLRAARAWLRREFDNRWTGYEHPSFLVQKLMEEAEQRFGLASFGVEGHSIGPSGARGIQFFDYGDPYDSTVVAVTTPNSVRFYLALGGWEAFA